MRTEIEFLSLLEEDLQIITELEAELGAPPPGSRSPRRRIVAAAAVACILAAGGIGYFARDFGDRRSDRGSLAGYSPATRGPTSQARVRGGPAVHGADSPILAPIQSGEFQKSLNVAEDRYGPVETGQLSSQREHGRPGSQPETGDSTVVSPKIIKTGRLEVEVRRGTFDRAFRDASLVADRYGGYLASSSMGGTTTKSGTLIMRVPARNFARAVADLSLLGKTLLERIHGEDVTADYVDLQGRIKTWVAQERVLLRLMAGAQSIDETLTVQRHLQNVQLQIEHLKGQLRVLRDQVADGTISVSIHEPAPRQPEGATTPISPGFGDTWRKTVSGFLDVVATVAIGLGYVIPIALLIGGAWLLVRRRIRARV